MNSPSTQVPAPTPTRRPRLVTALWFQVIVAAILGIAVGAVFPSFGATLAPLNDWFIALIKMIVVPVIFCVIVNGIASMDNLRKAGRIGLKSIGYFLALSLLSMVIGLMVANLFHAGLAGSRLRRGGLGDALGASGYVRSARGGRRH